MAEHQSQAPSPERWQWAISGPGPPIGGFHPAPFEQHLLEGSREPVWLDSLTARSMQRA